MALYPDYATRNEYKAFVHVETADTADDAHIDVALTTASRAIDQFCNRQFGSLTSAQTRYFTWDCLYIDNQPALPIFDLYSTTQLVVALDLDQDGTAETTLTLDTDFNLWPYNAANDGKPWTHIVLRPNSTQYFPTFSRGVEIAARWGWTAVPAAVEQACLLQTDVFMKRRQAGLVGDYSATSKYLDRDVQLILQPFRRVWGAV